MTASPIGRIVWPASPEAACRHYVTFAVKVIEPLGIEFPESLPNPLAAASDYIAGTLAESAYRQEMVSWWGYIDSVGGVREFQRREALIARLALCLFAFPDSADQLGEYVSWLFVVLSKLDVDVGPAETLRLRYFEYR